MYVYLRCVDWEKSSEDEVAGDKKTGEKPVVPEFADRYEEIDLEILRTDDPSTDKETKKSPSGNKTLKTEPPLLNEFMELKPSSVKSYHKPKVIENEVLRIGNHQNLIRRKLRSEEKSRNMRPEI